MKKLFFTIAIVAISGAIFAQNFKLDACDKFTEKSTTFYKSAVFNTAGINLNKYDWQDPTLNCHINSTMYQGKKAGLKKMGGIIAASVGGSFLIGGAQILAVTGSGGGAALTALGSLGLVGSVPLFIFSKKDKRKMNYHLDQVSEYYRTNNMF